MKKIFVSLCSFLCGATVFAQATSDFAGTWEGKLNLSVELRIVFHITETGAGGLQATGDSPDQSAYGLKCDTTFVKSGRLTIEMHDLNASFTGKQVNDSTIEGVFTQGADLPLILHRKKEMPAKLQIQQLPFVSYETTDVSVPAKDVTLFGTLFHPLNKQTAPVVLIIAGSGPTDRDGNSTILPGKNNSLLQLADSLAHYGIATLRYDKRMIGKSKMKQGMGEKDVTINEMMKDAVAMADWLKAKGYKDIYIAGHSEGSLIGMMVAGAIEVKGFISIAGAGRKAGEILKEQLMDQLSSSLKTEFTRAIDSLEQGLTVTKMDPSLVSLFRPSIQPYMKSWLPLDPQQLISKLKFPILLIQGTKDLQVQEKDAQNLHAAAKKSELVVIKDMNHVMKKIVSDKREDNFRVYSDPEAPLAGELVKAIASFINLSGK